MLQPDYGAIVSKQSITVHTYSGKCFSWNADQPNFSKVRDAIAANEPAATLEALMDLRGTVERATAEYGHVRIIGDVVYFKDKPLHTTLTDRILQHLNEGFPVDPLLRFADNLYQNQRKSAVDSLFDFLEANKIPFTPDGCFLVYKKVDDDYKDYYTHTFDNSVGTTVYVEPHEVEEDRSQTCSRGLHVCARHYLPSYYGGSGHVMICKVNPAHVVAVPPDYNNSKMRVYMYEVVGELKEEDKADIFDKVTYVSPGQEGPLRDTVTWSDDWLGSSLYGADDEPDDDDDEEEDNDGPVY